MGDTTDNRHAHTVNEMAPQVRTAVTRSLKWLRHLFHYWFEEPIGVIVPLSALLIILLAPQMPDMFAGLVAGENGSSVFIALCHASGYGLSAAFLGFSSWYWIRAALLARCKMDDFSRANLLLSQAQDRKYTLNQHPREWAPRVALVFAFLIALAPLKLLLGEAGGANWALIAASLFGVVFVRFVVIFAIFRHAILRYIGIPAGFRALPWMWRWPRPIKIIAAAPFGWPVALILILISCLGVAVVAWAPEWIEQNLSTPTAALAALGLLIPLLVLALAVVRSLVYVALFILLEVISLTVLVLRSWKELPSRVKDPKSLRVSSVNLGPPSNVIGLICLIAWVYFLPPFFQSKGLYDIRLKAVEHATEADDDKTDKSQQAVHRLSFEDAVLNWRKARYDAGFPKDKPMPAIIVAAEGGASRAAVWLLSAMKLLDEKTGGAFGQNLFAIIGVSGGSLGAVTYLQALKQYGHRQGGLKWEHARVDGGLRKLAEGDLLAASISTYFLNDTLGRVFGPFWINIPDRAEALERAFERHWESVDGFKIDQNNAESGLIALHRNGTANMPHLLLNGTDLKTGRRAITSTFRFGPTDDLFPASIDVLDETGRDIPAATAVTNSARFPYISPAGFYEIKHQSKNVNKGDKNGKKDDKITIREIVDGGYFENYGAGTATDLAYNINRLSEAKKLNLVTIVVVVSNDGEGSAPRSNSETDSGEIETLLPLKHITVNCSQDLKKTDPQLRGVKKAGLEIFTPFRGLYATRAAHGLDALHSLRRQLCPSAGKSAEDYRMIHIALPKPIPGKESAPLNWVLNPRVRTFLLEEAPHVPFNEKQAELLDTVLKSLLQIRSDEKKTAQTE